MTLELIYLYLPEELIIIKSKELLLHLEFLIINIKIKIEILLSGKSFRIEISGHNLIV